MIHEIGCYAFLQTSLLSNEIGILPNSDLYYRLIYLYELTVDWYLKEHIKELVPYPFALWEVISKENENAENNDLENKEIIENNLIETKGTSESNISPENMLFYLTMNPGVLGDKWKFHIGDVDFFPSVPHGHLNSNEAIKLDSYLGFTYDTINNNNNLKRESKLFISSLWNNHKFREFALNSINHFISINFNFHWRVNNPRRLPKIWSRTAPNTLCERFCPIFILKNAGRP